MPETLAAAFLAGLVGSTHCLGMCGGIAAALGMATAGERARGSRAYGYSLVYNTSRVASYAVAGAIAGALGIGLGQVAGPGLGFALRVTTGAVIIVIGLQVAYNLRLFRPLETAGFRLWQRIAPLARGLSGRRDLAGAAGLGALWGWLPCGLVYGMLLAAVGTGTPAGGAAMMLAFGLGTMPAMVATGALGAQVRRVRSNPRFRLLAGLVLVTMGLWTLSWPALMVLSGGGHGGH